MGEPALKLDKDHLFKPGTSGNPNGRPAALSPHLRALIRRNKDAFVILADKLLNATRDEVKTMLSPENVGSLSMNEAIMARLLMEAYEKRDQIRYGFVLDRLIGKPKETVEMVQEDHADDSFDAEAVAKVLALVKLKTEGAGNDAKHGLLGADSHPVRSGADLSGSSLGISSEQSQSLGLTTQESGRQARCDGSEVRHSPGDGELQGKPS